MARKSKWVEVQSAQEPVADVARRAIGDRLQLVWRYLRRASQGAPADTENVHQLRVGTRRAVAAMEIFDSLMPGRRKDWMNKQLTRIRRTAGEARDLDVMLDRFRGLAEAEVETDQYGALVHFLKVRRRRAQDPIDDRYEKLDRKDFRRRVRELVQRVRLRDKKDRFEQPTYSDSAHTALEPIVQKFFAASEADFSDHKLLHAFRIEGKHLRYAMEIFAAAFDTSFRDELYPLVVDLQERLGLVNDHATAHERFQAWRADLDVADPLQSTLETLAADEQEALRVAQSEFLDWWTPERRDELRKRIADALDMDISELATGIDPSPEEPSEPRIVLRRAE